MQVCGGTCSAQCFIIILRFPVEAFECHYAESIPKICLFGVDCLDKCPMGDARVFRITIFFWREVV